MAGAEAGAVVAMKIFVEKDEVAPVRIALEEFQFSCHRAPPVLSAQENMREPPGNFRGYLPEIGFVAGIGGAPHFKISSLLLRRFQSGVPHLFRQRIRS